MSTTQGTSPLGVAVVGCGNISVRYAELIAQYPEVRLVGAYDEEKTRLGEFAKTHGCQAYGTVAELLADPAVAIVVNLTSHFAHYPVSRECLQAGRHVYSEKPLAMTHAEATELVQLAADKNVRLGCSPSVWLAPAQQTAWQVVASGRLGQVRVVYAEVNHGRIESWHPAPEVFFEVGPVFDVGVYPLSYLTAVLGPVRSVTAYGKVVQPQRTTVNGVPFTVRTPDYVVASLETEAGPVIRLTCNFYVATMSRTRAGVEFHGDLASCRLGSWSQPLAEVEVGDFGGEYESVPLIGEATPGVQFARGLRDLAQAIAEDRPHRPDGEHGAHIVEVIGAIATSAREHHPVEVTSSFPQPAPIGWSLP